MLPYTVILTLRVKLYLPLSEVNLAEGKERVLRLSLKEYSDPSLYPHHRYLCSAI